METLSIALYTVGLLTMLAYCLYIGINYSISVTFYDSPQRRDWIFIVTMIIFSFSTGMASGIAGYYVLMAAAQQQL